VFAPFKLRPRPGWRLRVANYRARMVTKILVGIKLAGLGERLRISLSQVDFRKRSRKTVHAHRQVCVRPRTVSCCTPALESAL